MDAPFDQYAHDGQDFMARQFRHAMGVRNRAPHRAEIDNLRRRFDASPMALLLESVGVAGRYRVAWIAEEDEELVLVTDFRLDDVPDEPFAGGPVDLVEYRISDAATVAQVRARIARLQFDDGPGGDDRRVDGMVQFLWTKAAGAERHTALYGHSYPAIHGSYWRPPGQDGLRWDAVVAAYEIWRDLARAAGHPVRVVAQRVR